MKLLLYNNTHTNNNIKNNDNYNDNDNDNNNNHHHHQSAFHWPIHHSTSNKQEKDSNLIPYQTQRTIHVDSSHHKRNICWNRILQPLINPLFSFTYSPSTSSHPTHQHIISRHPTRGATGWPPRPCRTRAARCSHCHPRPRRGRSGAPAVGCSPWWPPEPLGEQGGRLRKRWELMLKA